MQIGCPNPTPFFNFPAPTYKTTSIQHPHFFLNNVREQGLPSCFTPVLVRGLVAQEDRAELTVSGCGSPGLDNTLPDPCLCCSRAGQNQHQTPTHFSLQRRKGRSSAHAPGLCTNPRLSGSVFMTSAAGYLLLREITSEDT